MSILDWFRPKPVPPAAAPVEPKKPVASVSPIAAARAKIRTRQEAQPFALTIPKPPPGVVPKGASTMAMDDAIGSTLNWASESLGSIYGGAEGVSFIGYPLLAELAQRPEYRLVSETIATEMTRRWIKIQAAGEDDKSERIDLLSKAMDRLGVRDVFRRVAEQDGFFGRSHIYPDFGDKADAELLTPIGNGRDKVSVAKVDKGSLKAIRTVEPYWCYPVDYNTTNPLAANWYVPQAWYVMGKKVHASRLIPIVGREVPDILKAAYSFGGLSMSQMLLPYVNIWLQTRQSVANLITSFSVKGIKIDLPNALQNDAEGLFNRVSFFNDVIANGGTMVLGKGSGPTDPPEEFFNVSTPLGTLDALQAQSQEHMASIARIPLVKLTGITPSGLNASTDGEVRSFYDWIHANQEQMFREPLTAVMGFIQLSEFGDIDPDITFQFEHLWSMNEKEAAEVDLVEAQTGAMLIEAGVLLPEEERKRIASDPETPYPGLNLSLELNPPDLKEPDDLPNVPKPSDGE